MKLSELDFISKKEFKKKVFDHKLKYKNNISFSKKIKFGIEIEVIGEDFIDVMRNKKNIDYYKIPEYKPSNVYDYDNWIITTDDSIEGKGGELDSPILSDNKESWLAIKKMLKYIDDHVFFPYIDDDCSNHIHFDSNILNKNPEKLYAFMIMLAETEPILTRFYNGEYINLRKAADVFAKPFTDFFLNAFPINTDSYISILNSLYDFERTNVRYKKYAFDFSRLYLYENYEQGINTIETRIPNGTLNPIIIQNNIMLMGHLLMCIANNKYDYEQGLYRIKVRDRKAPIIDEELAFYVADFIEDDNLKLDFLKQYYKDGSVTTDKKLKKSLEFY